ncbi:MAG: 5'-methylthioadenosine/adenosylhomocysteine nucleosidase [Kiritimatiellae bacterium]|nr:5'-methylthioadenosine/adenosylhomocysteine nucleosidase [Kiritimatiellia bacterium]
MIGLICAMPEEAARLKGEMSDVRVESRGQRQFVRGRIAGREAVLAISRCGKVAAAATAAAMIERYGTAPLVVTGAAGALSPELEMGDIVVADELVQHDLDASALPMFRKFEVPLLGVSRFASDPSLREAARRAAEEFVQDEFPREVPAAVRSAFGVERPRVWTGTVTSGDRFIAHEEERAALARELPDAICVEMEGAAVAQVAFEYEVPFVVVRTISDAADRRAPEDFQRFMDAVVSHITAGVVRRLLARMQ